MVLRRVTTEKSLNTLVRQLLARCVGLDPAVGTHSDLNRFAGTLTDEDQREFDEATRPFRGRDDELWR